VKLVEYSGIKRRKYIKNNMLEGNSKNKISEIYIEA
jgi:hypothetical protein